VRCHIGLIEQNLTLQVTRFNKVTVHQTDKTNTSSHKRIGQHRAKGTNTAQQHARGQKLFLPGTAELAKAHLPAVPFKPV
jgi:hypothetical protein